MIQYSSIGCIIGVAFYLLFTSIGMRFVKNIDVRVCIIVAGIGLAFLFIALIMIYNMKL